jgi:hypothetical protein
MLPCSDVSMLSRIERNVCTHLATSTAPSHHPSAASSHRRSVVLGAESLLVPSEGAGASRLSVPNTLRHVSLTNQKGVGTPTAPSLRLPNSLIPKHERLIPRQRRVA